MLARTVWKDKMRFTGEVGPYTVDMDSKPPLGDGSAMTPKELVAVGLGGCTAMDVVSLMKKYRQPLESLEVSAEITQTDTGHPVVFKDIALTFSFLGKLDKEKVVEAVRLSQTRFCGVSAMLSKSAPILYKILLNGEELAAGEASFGEETF